MRLVGKSALVTGASSGLGEATALQLAAEGASVLLAARRIGRLKALEKQIQDRGGKAVSVEVDIAKEADVRRMVETAQATFGRIDILINNAGVMFNSPVLNAKVDDWRAMLEINVLGLIAACHAVLPLMKAQGGGHIVNLSSVAALNANPGAGVYSASKAAVSVFSESIRKEFHRDNIRVTTIAPGVIATELPDHIADAEMKDRFREWMKTMTPLQPDEVAETILFALTRPPHMCIGEMVIRPTQQER